MGKNLCEIEVGLVLSWLRSLTNPASTEQAGRSRLLNSASLAGTAAEAWRSTLFCFFSFFLCFQSRKILSPKNPGYSLPELALSTCQTKERRLPAVKHFEVDATLGRGNNHRKKDAFYIVLADTESSRDVARVPSWKFFLQSITL